MNSGMGALTIAHEIWTLLTHPSISAGFNRLWSEWGYSDKIWVHLALGDMFMHSVCHFIVL
jgi:hypothetical protein